MDDEGRQDAARAGVCAGCGATLGADQRYCLECGVRRAPLPPLVAAQIGALQNRGGGVKAGNPRPSDDGTPVAVAEAEGRPTLEERFMPSPRVAAVAVMGLLAFGVFLGSATSPLAQSAGIASILLEGGSSSSPSSPTTEASAPASTPEPSAAAAPARAAAPTVLSQEAPITYEEGSAGEEAGQKKPSTPPEVPSEAPLPPIKHVFLIVLADQGFNEAYGESSAAPYLAKTLRGQGELLTNYYAVAQGELANEVALISGQGPTPQTAANCPNYTEISPGTIGAESQVTGSGCVYPSATLTLPGQLATAGKSWKAYVEGVGNGGAGQPSTCRHPALGSADGNQSPLPGDAYETWRNPFVYFDSLSGSECVQDDVGLEQLQTDLQSASSTPSLSYIVPSACHDGSEKPCAAGAPAGIATAEPFLKTVVPEIEASAAYKQEGGLIAITSDQAPQTGPNADSSSCCGVPQYPNLPAPPASAASGPVKSTGGGGRVGLLLISPYVKPGTVDETGYYNHFSLLHSLEELFGLQPLGYAANPALTGFESGVYNNSNGS